MLLSTPNSPSPFTQIVTQILSTMASEISLTQPSVNFPRLYYIAGFFFFIAGFCWSCKQKILFNFNYKSQDKRGSGGAAEDKRRGQKSSFRTTVMRSNVCRYFSPIFHTRSRYLKISQPRLCIPPALVDHWCDPIFQLDSKSKPTDSLPIITNMCLVHRTFFEVQSWSKLISSGNYFSHWFTSKTKHYDFYSLGECERSTASSICQLASADGCPHGDG